MARILRNAASDDVAAQLSKLKADLVELGRVVSDAADKEKKVLADTLLTQARGAVDTLSDTAANWGEKTASLRKDTAAAASRVGDMMSEHADDIASVLASEIRDRPLRTLAIAGGLGLIVGWLTRR